MYTFEYIQSLRSRTDIVNFLRDNCKSDYPVGLEYFKLPTLLYRYTSLNSFTVKNLKENTLTATSPTEFNDIYDSTMHFNTVAQYQNEITKINNMSKDIGHSEIINNNIEEALLKGGAELDIFKLTYLTNDYRIVCFSTDYKDIKMWSHYGNMNKGICIEYDFSKSNYGLDKSVFPVIYIKEPFDVTELTENIDNISLAVLVSIITKSIVWQDEKEWRLVFYFGQNNNKRIPLINIPKPERIILGYKFIDEYIKAKEKGNDGLVEEFLKYISNSGIKLNIMEPQIRRFELGEKEIEVDEIKNLAHY